MSRELKVALSMILATLAVSWIYLAVNKKPVVLDFTATAAQAQPKPIPLTRIFDKSNAWQVASAFELVDGTASLYVAQAHKPGIPEHINYLIYLEATAYCCPGEKVIFPRVGEMIKIQKIEIRATAGPGVITETPNSVSAFVQSKCQ